MKIKVNEKWQNRIGKIVSSNDKNEFEKIVEIAIKLFERNNDFKFKPTFIRVNQQGIICREGLRAKTISSYTKYDFTRKMMKFVHLGIMERTPGRHNCYPHSYYFPEGFFDIIND